MHSKYKHRNNKAVVWEIVFNYKKIFSFGRFVFFGQVSEIFSFGKLLFWGLSISDFFSEWKINFFR